MRKRSLLILSLCFFLAASWAVSLMAQEKPPIQEKKEGLEASQTRLAKPLEEASGRSPIEESFNQRIPSFKNRLEQEFKEKISTDRPLSPEEAKALKENIAKSLFNEYDRRLEKDFEKEILQFGYNIFEQPASPFAPLETAPVGPDYVLGPEDTLIIQMWGMTNEVFKVTITREGKINLPKVGALFLWGMSFNDAEKKIKEGLSRFYKDIQIDVSLGGLRNIKVFVLGEVKKPGGYTISSLSTMLHALYHAGGPTKFGSLRNIKLIRKGDTDKVFDLYPLLLHGERKADVRLINDDIIFVPQIGELAGISGNVKTPAIYETEEKLKLSDLIKMSGGLNPSAYLQKIQVNRIVANKQVTIAALEISGIEDLDKSPQNIEMRNRDLILISSIDKRKRGFVAIKGNVHRPGEYKMTPNMKVNDLIAEAQGLLPETYLERAEILRYKSDYTREIIPFEVSLALKKGPAHDLLLKEWDIVEIKSVYDIYPKPIVHISGEVHKPGTFRFVTGMRVSDLIYQAQEVKDTAYLERGELYRKTYDREKPLKVIMIDLKAVLQKNSEADLLLEKEDLLVIYPIWAMARTDNVHISGEVHKPGTYRFAQNLRVSDLIYQAQELKDTAYLEKAELYRKNYGKEKPPEVLALNLRAILQKDKAADLVLEKEDHLFILPNPERIEKWLVSLNGEVRFPGAYIIKKGEKLGSVIERAGGFNPHAFLKGTVFTRKSLAAKRQPIIDDFIRAQKRVLLEKEAEIAESNFSLEGKESRRIALAKKREALNLIGAKTFLGRIIIDLNDPASKNFLLEDGDNLSIPVEPQTVLIIGEVYNPESIAFTPGKGIDYYLNKVGGVSEKADRPNLYVIKPDGQVESRATGFSEITQGDIVVVPSKIE